MKNHVVILAGCSGLTGGFLLSELIKNTSIHNIFCTYRKHKPSSAVGKIKHILFNPIEHLSDEFPTADIAFCCIGTTMAKAGSKKVFREADVDFVIAFAKKAKGAGVKTFVLQSSVGADASSSNFYLACKGEAEDAIYAMDFENFHIYRPSLLMGPRKEQRFGERIAQRLFPLFQWLIPSKYKGVHVKDLAYTMMMHALDPSNKGNQVFHYANYLKA